MQRAGGSEGGPFTAVGRLNELGLLTCQNFWLASFRFLQS